MYQEYDLSFRVPLQQMILYVLANITHEEVVLLLEHEKILLEVRSLLGRNPELTDLVFK